MRRASPRWRARGAERSDLRMAIKILGDAVADGARIIPEHRIECRNVVADQRFLVALERRLHLGDDLGQIDLHRCHCFGRGAAAIPALSSAHAMASATSSRQGAAMICTPIGNGSSGTGTATAGSPMNEIGWV